VGRGIDAELFHPRHRSDALRQHWGVSAEDLVVIHVGRIAAEKNLQAAADAFERMAASRPNAKMVWVGDGPLLKSMKKRYPNHIFTGAKLDMELAQHYASADLFLFPSMTETFGNVVLEAMSSGLAVVAYRYAAAETYIFHGKSGLLAAFGDNREFMQQALTLAGDLPAIRSVGVAARKAIEDQPWDEVCMKFESLLCAAVKGEALCLSV
jgi:glycosyltransferase involved in cell wall biosynthesis